MTAPAQVRQTYDIDDLTNELFDLLSRHSNGLDIHSITEMLGIPRETAVKVLRYLRLTLAAGDSINVPWRTEGRRRIYFLAGSVADGQIWQAARMKGRLSNLDVDIAWWRSMVAATDGRTPNGRLARRVCRHFEGVAADVRELQEEID